MRRSIHPLLPLQRLYRWERQAPDRVAFVQPVGDGKVVELSWSTVIDQARRMAAHLQKLGFEPGSRIGILGKNCAWWLICDYAIWMAGYVSVPLYPTLTAQTLLQILDHSEARLVFVGKLDGWQAMRSGVPERVPCIGLPLAPEDVRRCPDTRWEDIVIHTAPIFGRPVRQGSDLATIMYTSGTSGTPKGVMHSFLNFAYASDAAFSRMDAGPEARMLSYLPLAHVAERTLVEHGQLATGMRVYFAESSESFARDVQRARPTIFFSVPRLWTKFQQGVHAKIAPPRLKLLLELPLIGNLVRRRILKSLGLDQCRYAAGGAAPMPPGLLHWYSLLGLDIMEAYGMTENCGVSHATLAAVRRPGTVGLPQEGIEARIDPVTSEIQIRSGALMLGYYKEPILTADTFTSDGWLRTGDEGLLDPEDGCLRITGRLKDAFKTSKGEYITPASIEDRLMAHPAIEACCVTGANHPQPFALVALSAVAAAQAADVSARAALEASLAEHLRTVNRALHPHERLEMLVLMTEPWSVDNGLVTPTLKVKRHVVEERWASRFDEWTADRRNELVWA
jgi:long-chain acyl-CoA synthetase